METQNISAVSEVEEVQVEEAPAKLSTFVLKVPAASFWAVLPAAQAKCKW